MAMMNALLSLALAVTPSPVFAQGADEYEARLTEVKGQVLVFAADGDPEGVDGAAGMPLAVGDRVKTGEDSSAEIVVDGDAVIALKPNSDFTLTSLNKAETEFKLDLGSLLARIKTVFAGGAVMRVRTPTAIAAVRGTEFGVEVSAEETYVGVFDEGKLEVSDQSGTVERLIANQETLVRRGQRPLTPYVLNRFMRHRQFMRAMRKRAPLLRKAWKALPPAERLKLRRQIVERQRERRREMLEKRLQQRDKRQERKRDLREDQKKMERRRDDIRRRRQAP